MKNRIPVLFVGIILALVFLLTFVSAASFSNTAASLVFDPTVTVRSFTLTLNNQSELADFSLGTMSITGEDGYVVSFSAAGDLSDVNTTIVNITPTTSINYNKFSFGKIYSSSFLITRDGIASDNSSVSIKIENTKYCGSVGNSFGSDFKISEVSFDNRGKFGDDDVWYPRTNVDVEVTVENNNGDYDINDVELRWALYSNDGTLIMDGKESKVDIDSDDEQNYQFTITLDENLDDLSDEAYTFYIKAFGEADNDANDNLCTEEAESVEVVVENDFVVLDDISYNNDTTCGSELHITADVWNIGSDKQTDVYVRVYNQELGINKNVEVGDINQMESEGFDFSFTIPSNITAKLYPVQLEVYDDSDDIYQNGDDDESRETVLVVVSGCAPSISGLVSGGDIQSGGNAGKDLAVKVSVTNTGKALTTYTVNPTSYSDWADSVTLDQSIVAISPGQSKEVVLTFKTKDVETGTYNFNVELVANSKTVATQPFQVLLENSLWFGNSNLSDSFGDNWYLWVIGALNVLLVIIIILVAIRVARR